MSKSHMMVTTVLSSGSALSDKPITSLHLRYPRKIHGEFMTHRVFGRNARSSRAVPVNTMLEEVRKTPMVPWHWGKNQKGMQAEKEHNAKIKFTNANVSDPDLAVSREAGWLYARDQAADAAEAFMNAGYHKQLVNRLLEPFSWIDTLVTSTEWENFLWLRDHKDAEPHMRDLAQMVKEELEKPVMQELKEGEWHLPYITDEDRKAASVSPWVTHTYDGFLRKISAARCARISYKPFDGDASYKKELARYDQLINSERLHASPLEHQATPDRLINTITYQVDDTGLRIGVLHEGKSWASPTLHGNLKGWIQNRKLVELEMANTRG